MGMTDDSNGISFKPKILVTTPVWFIGKLQFLAEKIGITFPQCTPL